MTTVAELGPRFALGREAELFPYGDGFVLRLLFAGRGSRERMERERDVLLACRAAGIPVPAPGEPLEIEGRFGLVLGRVDGRDLFGEIARRPWTVYVVGRQTGALHARVNATPAPKELPEVRDVLRGAIERGGAPLPPGIQGRALEILGGLPAGDRLLHGDFHPGNILAGKDGPVVIDWTGLAGHPLADFTRSSLLLRAAAPPPGAPLMIRILEKPGRRALIAGYERAYRNAVPRIDAELHARWTCVNIAARLLDEIPGERTNLLRMWDRLARKT